LSGPTRSPEGARAGGARGAPGNPTVAFGHPLGYNGPSLRSFEPVDGQSRERRPFPDPARVAR